MAQMPAVSIIVVSLGRPQLLRRCLTGLSQLFYPNFEVIVVADDAGIEAVKGSNLPAQCIPFNEPNISKARNLGLAQAAGEVVAFIDDDAVPEPTWLDHLAAPFAADEVQAAGGYVRGRNGVSFQWTAQGVDRNGVGHPLTDQADAPQIHHPTADFAIKTEGTNCAFRRNTLLAMGGFDEAFAFYLDETDVNMRFADLGHATAIVPNAQVLHGYAESRYRGQNRAPKDLTQIGRSTAIFLRKHGRKGADQAAFDAARRTQENAVTRHMVDGTIEPADVKPLLVSFENGWRKGLGVDLSAPQAITATTRKFTPFKSELTADPGQILAGRIWQAKTLRAKAHALVAQGCRVTLVLLSPSILPMREKFTEQGWWERSGGIFGCTERRDCAFRLTTFSKRVSSEVKNLVTLRGLEQKKKKCHD